MKTPAEPQMMPDMPAPIASSRPSGGHPPAQADCGCSARIETAANPIEEHEGEPDQQRRMGYVIPHRADHHQTADHHACRRLRQLRVKRPDLLGVYKQIALHAGR
jgi:hypothetical protein